MTDTSTPEPTEQVALEPIDEAPRPKRSLAVASYVMVGTAALAIIALPIVLGYLLAEEHGRSDYWRAQFIRYCVEDTGCDARAELAQEPAAPAPAAEPLPGSPAATAPPAVPAATASTARTVSRARTARTASTVPPGPRAPPVRPGPRAPTEPRAPTAAQARPVSTARTAAASPRSPAAPRRRSS
ncbi:hypothetical protein OVA14_07285 [Agrococcus sp. SL85]|uniref:hypothetical protein n=1 Tax=Agrococcus sp. SL85 TaxID=2995141 RepID=UPI00226C6BF4|nr:hypothetical protein [Agrococcus sp. SL85]WAC65196.1 hypothetical protein OVA14_07285 [Agrococcus sp. SL85]